jgi:hypothetical protein
VNPAHRTKRRNPLLWLYEPLEDDPRFVLRKLFNMDAAYLDGKLYLGVVEGREPWNGLMVCTFREHHAGLQSQFPQLVSHKVLGKWLYLSQSHPAFESVATELVEMARKRDARLGVQPQPHTRKGTR